jgi:excisionase family DNA binding protein
MSRATELTQAVTKISSIHRSRQQKHLQRPRQKPTICDMKSNPKTNVPSLTYSIQEAAQALGIGKDRAYKLIKTNALRGIQSSRGRGCRIRIPIFEVHDYLRRELEKLDAP